VATVIAAPLALEVPQPTLPPSAQAFPESAVLGGPPVRQGRTG